MQKCIQSNNLSENDHVLHVVTKIWKFKLQNYSCGETFVPLCSLVEHLAIPDV